ncbi:MAG TPA: ATP-dependent metallopeptidase FtsH/Yme1/Tma family protein, partial [Acidimicrobiales bacterium]|nr:ATP-dependent metallopeptidase FtsH/Yme1/Tma family protein [Acidimicrobiales bacterium]
MSSWHTHKSTSARPGPPHDRAPVPPPPPPRWRPWLLLLGIVLTLTLLFRPSMSSTPTKSLTYSDFQTQVTADQVTTATIDPNGRVTGKLKSGDNYTAQIPTAIRD